MNQPDYIIKDVDVGIDRNNMPLPIIVSVHCSPNPSLFPTIAALGGSEERLTIPLSPQGAHDLAQKILATVEMLNQQE